MGGDNAQSKGQYTTGVKVTYEYFDWLYDNLEKFWLTGRVGFLEKGRGAVVANKYLQNVEPDQWLWYADLNALEEAETEGIYVGNLVCNYDPNKEIVLIVFHTPYKYDAFRQGALLGFPLFSAAQDCTAPHT